MNRTFATVTLTAALFLGSAGIASANTLDWKVQKHQSTAQKQVSLNKAAAAKKAAAQAKAKADAKKKFAWKAATR